MAVKVGFTLTQFGTGDYKIVEGKDVDITTGYSELTTLENADIFLVDDNAAGTQASTKYISASNMKTYFQSGLQTTLTFGIGNTNAVKIDAADVEDNDYARFTANGLEGRTLAEIKGDIGTGNSALVPAAGSSGEFLAHDGAFATPPNDNTNQLTTFTLRDDDDDNFTIAHGKFLKVVSAVGAAGTDIAGTGTTTDPFVLTITNPNTEYTVGDAGLTEKNFTTALNTKLTNIESNADVTDTTNVEAAGALMDSEITNLSQIKSFDSSDYATASQGALADSAQQPPSEGAFADGDKTKLDGIETNADVTDTANVTSAGALMDSELTDLAGVKGVTISTLQVKPSEGAFVNGDKTKLDGIAELAEVNVQSNWNESDSNEDSFIQNKPNIAYTSAISEGNSGLVPAAGTSGHFLAHNGAFAQVAYSNVSGTPSVMESANSYAAGLVPAGSGTHNDTYLRKDGTWATPINTDTDTQLTTEEVQDIVGAMFSGNTETRIAAVYQDGDGTIDLSVDDMTVTNYITNDADDIMEGNLIVSNKNPSVSAGNSPGSIYAFNQYDDITDTDTNSALSAKFLLDLTLTPGQTTQNYGAKIEIDSSVNTHSSSLTNIINYGTNIHLKANTSANLTAQYGINLNVEGGDAAASTGIYIDNENGGKDIKLVSSADNDDYSTISTGLYGATTLETIDGNVARSVAHFVLDADGDITLDSNTGNFIAKRAGTEFSAANSAYAGMILGYTRIANDGTASVDNLIALTSSMTVLETNHNTRVSVAFKAPPSGNVEIQFSCRLYTLSTTVAFALSSAGLFSEVDETHTYDAGAYRMDESDVNTINISWAVTGLTPGVQYTYFIAGQETSGSTATIAHGRFRTGGQHYPPILVKAVALPATITTAE